MLSRLLCIAFCLSGFLGGICAPLYTFMHHLANVSIDWIFCRLVVGLLSTCNFFQQVFLYQPMKDGLQDAFHRTPCISSFKDTSYTQNARLSTSYQNSCHQNSFIIVIQKAVSVDNQKVVKKAPSHWLTYTCTWCLTWHQSLWLEFKDTSNSSNLTYYRSPMITYMPNPQKRLFSG